jgi:hypothetical protein
VEVLNSKNWSTLKGTPGKSWSWPLALTFFESGVLGAEYVWHCGARKMGVEQSPTPLKQVRYIYIVLSKNMHCKSLRTSMIFSEFKD